MNNKMDLIKAESLLKFGKKAHLPSFIQVYTVYGVGVILKEQSVILLQKDCALF